MGKRHTAAKTQFEKDVAKRNYKACKDRLRLKQHTVANHLENPAKLDTREEAEEDANMFVLVGATIKRTYRQAEMAKDRLVAATTFIADASKDATEMHSLMAPLPTEDDELLEDELDVELAQYDEIPDAAPAAAATASTPLNPKPVGVPLVKKNRAALH